MRILSSHIGRLAGAALAFGMALLAPVSVRAEDAPSPSIFRNSEMASEQPFTRPPLVVVPSAPAQTAQPVAAPVAMSASEAELRKKIGQMIILGFSGDSAETMDATARLIETGAIGGVIYFKSNVGSLEDVRRMNERFRSASPGLPPFIAVDQEGGLVQRLTEAMGFPDTPSAAKIAATMRPAGAETVYERMAQGLAALGFNLNFGPVVDVDLNSANPVIGKIGRSFGNDPAKVAQYAAAFISAHHKYGILTALKHFPGHGSSAGDTHDGFVDITRTWNRDAELLPYRTLIDKPGMIDMVMVGHLYNAEAHGAQDQSAQYPATLSQRWIEGELRSMLGYSGVVVTDDLNMGAITKEFGTDTAIVKAIDAGGDILLFSDPGKDPAAFARHVADVLVEASRSITYIPIAIEFSYGRITALKQRIGALPPARQFDAPDPPFPAPARPFSS